MMNTAKILRFMLTNTIIESVKKYINQMKACDFYALSNKDFYWSIMAQQMMDGNI